MAGIYFRTNRVAVRFLNYVAPTALTRHLTASIDLDPSQRSDPAPRLIQYTGLPRDFRQWLFLYCATAPTLFHPTTLPVMALICWRSLQGPCAPHIQLTEHRNRATPITKMGYPASRAAAQAGTVLWPADPATCIHLFGASRIFFRSAGIKCIPNTLVRHEAAAYRGVQMLRTTGGKT